MPFVKLDTGILDSTLWVDLDARNVFITALLMAEPFETAEPSPQIEIRSLRETGFVVPPGRYGFVRAAGVGILRRAGLADTDEGLAALERLGLPEADSRTPDFEGRRLVRVDGGFLVLNFDRYRRMDYTAAARQQRHRARHAVTPLRHAVTPRDVTQAEAEAKVETTTTATPDREPTERTLTPLADQSHEDTKSDPVQALWTVWLEELGGRPPHPRLIDERRQKLGALYREHLSRAADPREAFRAILRRVKASEFHMGKREYQLPESLFRNEGRRDRWASGHVGGQGDGDGRDLPPSIQPANDPRLLGPDEVLS